MASEGQSDGKEDEAEKEEEEVVDSALKEEPFEKGRRLVVVEPMRRALSHISAPFSTGFRHNNCGKSGEASFAATSS